MIDVVSMIFLCKRDHSFQHVCSSNLNTVDGQCFMYFSNEPYRNYKVRETCCGIR
jgi:hypothetical protein